MTNVIKLNSHNNANDIRLIEEQAAEWFSLIELGDADPSDYEVFTVWLTASPLHSEIYQCIASTWDEMELLPLSEFESNEHNDSSFSQCKSEKNNNHWALFTSLAASFVFCAFIVFFTGYKVKESTIAYTTAVSEVSEIQLEDGSMITLGASSKLEVSMTEHIRQVTLLKGQAYFKIARVESTSGQRIPFYVDTGNARVEVLGTEFDIKRHEHKTDIAVTEGLVSVKLAQTEQAKELKVGQAVAVIGAAATTFEPVKKIETGYISSWRTGRLIYLDASLEDVISDAKRYHTASISLSDKSLGQLRITTSFNTNEVSNMAMILEDLLPVKVYVGDKKQIVIAPDKTLKKIIVPAGGV